MQKFLDKSNFIEKRLLKINGKYKSKDPKINIILGEDLKDRDDIKNILVTLNEYQLKGVKSIIKLLETKISYHTSFSREGQLSEKLKWIGKPAHFGYFIAILVEKGYIEAPKRIDKEINYTQFSKLAKNSFDVNIAESSLQKYLNLDSEKGQEPARTFSGKLIIPDVIEVS